MIKFFASWGVAPGYGEKRPLANNHFLHGIALSDCVDFQVVMAGFLQGVLSRTMAFRTVSSFRMQAVMATL